MFSKTGERNNRGQQSPTCKMKKGREEGEVLGAEDQTCNEGRHAAHKVAMLWVAASR